MGCHHVIDGYTARQTELQFPTNTVFYSMNWLSNELQFAIHQIGFWDLQFIRQVLNSDAAAGAAASAAASDATTAKAVIETEAAAEAAEAAAPAAASEFKTYLMNCQSKKPI